VEVGIVGLGVLSFGGVDMSHAGACVACASEHTNAVVHDAHLFFVKLDNIASVAEYAYGEERTMGQFRYEVATEGSGA
jgi:hypothetical protein